jgi:hypothetical protein
VAGGPVEQPAGLDAVEPGSKRDPVGDADGQMEEPGFGLPALGCVAGIEFE